MFKSVFRLIGLGAAVAILLMAAGNIGQVGSAQNCTVTLRPGDSIQEAILNASSGDVICLSAGTYRENIGFPKSLTLRGAGMTSTKIVALVNNSPVIGVSPQNKSVTVNITDLTVTGGYGSLPQGIDIGWITSTGINVTLQSVRISGNNGCGIVMGGGDWQVSVQNSEIYGNDCGIFITSGRLYVNNTEIRGNESDGFFAMYEARASISNSLIRGNDGWGIRVALRKCGWSQDEFWGSVNYSNTTVSSNGQGDVCL